MIYLSYRNFLNQIKEASDEVLNKVVKNSMELEIFRATYLGVKGKVKLLMGEIKNLSPEKKHRGSKAIIALMRLAEGKYSELSELIKSRE